jgi:hypothetical protein
LLPKVGLSSGDEVSRTDGLYHGCSCCARAPPREVSRARLVAGAADVLDHGGSGLPVRDPRWLDVNAPNGLRSAWIHTE